MRPITFFLTAMSFLAAPLASAQGTLVVHAENHRVGLGGTFTIQAQSGNLAMDMKPSDGSIDDAMAMVFRGDRGEMIMMDHSTRSYMVFDEHMVQELKDRMATVADEMSDVAEQMAGQLGGLSPELLARMPPEARAKFEEAMDKMKAGNLQGLVPGGEMSEGALEAQTTPELAPMTRTSETGSAAGARCRWYERIEGEKRHRYCAAAAGDVQGGEDVVRAMRGMVEFYSELAASFGAGMKDNPMATSPFFASNVLLEDNLLPVKTEEYDGDELVEETELTSATGGSIPSSVFQPREGYTERSMMGGMPRR